MFKIQQYGKSELALMYFPGASTSRGALSNLTYWIRCNRELSVALKKCGEPIKPRVPAFFFTCGRKIHEKVVTSHPIIQ